MTTTTTTRTTTTGPRLAPDLVVRVAGLPVGTLERLACPRGLRWAEETLDAEAVLREVSDRLADALANAIGGVGDQRARRALLRLRRDVHNLRHPARPWAERSLVAEAAPAAALLLDGWLATHQRLAELRGEGARVLDAELAASRAELRSVMADPRMRNGLLLASPDLEAQLDGYLAGNPEPATKRMRKVERSAVAYAYRAAAKPSPFSTFTAVAPGRLADRLPAGAPAGGPAGVPAAWESRVRLNVVVLSRLADAVLADPARRAHLPVVPASGWMLDAERVRYVRRSLRPGDTAATVTLDSARDQLFFLRRSDLLEEMLALVGREPAPLHHEVAAWLADRLGADLAECEHYLGDLLALGLLQVPLLATGVHTVDPLRSFQAALRALHRPWAEALASALDGPARCLADYPAADPGRRRRLLEELRAGLGAAMELLSAPASSLPGTVLYEDVIAGDEPVVCEAAQWRALAEQPLRSLARVLPAFDQTLRHRRTLHAFFLARFGAGGRCEDLVRLVHDFHEDIDDEYQSFTARRPRLDEDGRLVGDPNWLGDPVVEALDAARRLLADRLGERVAAGPATEEVELDAGLLDEVAAHLGGAEGGRTAVTHYLQRAGDLVVHNSAYGGLAFPFSRFTHWLGEELVERLRERARSVTPRGAVLAEVTGGFATSNLNLHRRLTDHEIVCPGEATAAPAEARIALEDLVLEHDAATDRLVLRSRRLDREVVPVYFGYLVPQALPAVSRTLLLLSGSSTFWLDPWAGSPAPPPRGGVEHRPRLRLGRMVLSRRSWTIGAGDLLASVDGRGPRPTVRGAADHAEELLAWQRWRRRHGVPRRVFATVRPPRGSAPPGPRPKPLPVDFGSLLSLRVLRSALTRPDARVELTEMLPGPEHAEVCSPDGLHVAELAVETDPAAAPAAGPGTPEEA